LLILIAAVYFLLHRHQQMIVSRLDKSMDAKTKIVPVPHGELSGGACDDSLHNAWATSYKHELSAETTAIVELYGTGPCVEPRELT